MGMYNAVMLNYAVEYGKYCDACQSAVTVIIRVWPKARPGPRKRGQLGLKSGPARLEPFTCHY